MLREQLGPDGFNDAADSGPESIKGSFGGFTQEGFDFGEDLFNGVEVGRIRRQIKDFCTFVLDHLPDTGNLVAAQVVADDDITWLECRAELGFHINQESCAIHGRIQTPRRKQTVKMQSGNESHGFVTAGSMVIASLSHRTAAILPRHVRACSRFIEKDQASGIAGLLPVSPNEPCRRHVSTLLFAGLQCFFYNCIPAIG